MARMQKKLQSYHLLDRDSGVSRGPDNMASVIKMQRVKNVVRTLGILIFCLKL